MTVQTISIPVNAKKTVDEVLPTPALQKGLVIDKGDHSFGLPKSDPVPPEKVYGQIVDTCMDWISCHGN